MSETAGTGRRATTGIPDTTRDTSSGTRGTSSGTRDTAGAVGATPGVPVVHESYSFACMRCGHGWEQSYAIEHHTDAQGKEFVVYTTGGRQVPSPLSQPTCEQCGGHVVRIMGSGRVSSVRDTMRREHLTVRTYGATAAVRRTGSTRADATHRRRRGSTAATKAGDSARGARHLWHMSNLLRLLHVPRRGTH